MHEIRQFFDYHATNWDYKYDEQKMLRLRSLFSTVIPPLESPILDLGCGTGVLLSVLGENDPYFGVDISLGMLRKFCRKARKNAMAIQADAHHLPFACNRFNSVIAFQALPHFVDRTRVLAEIERGLRPGGLFIVLHLMNHQELNNYHRNAGAAVSKHRLPPASVLMRQLGQLGFCRIHGREEEHLYLVVARKASTRM